jgi:biotin carboxyl carrier protein
MKLKIKLNNNEYDLNVTRRAEQVKIVRDGQETTLTVREVGENSVTIEHNGRLIRLAGAKNGDQRQLWVDGRVIKYERVQKRAGASAADVGSLSASIPAVVSAILVNVGDEVTAGDKLILLESMKMVIPIQAPSDGVVTAVKCAVGDSVQPGVPLVVVGQAD